MFVRRCSGDVRRKQLFSRRDVASRSEDENVAVSFPQDVRLTGMIEERGGDEEGAGRGRIANRSKFGRGE